MWVVSTVALVSFLTQGLAAPSPHLDTPGKVFPRYVEAGRITEKLHVGCFEDSASERDLPYNAISGDHLMTATKCQDLCRIQGFLFSGIQKGQDCYCGNSLGRKYDESTECNIPCPGDQSQSCGGANTNDVYRVNLERRYAGCYNDSIVDRDLPHKMWGTTGRPPVDCVNECMSRSYKYAGVQAGGECYCGNEYGSVGEADEMVCYTACNGYSEFSCGADLVNAVYLAEPAYDISDGSIDQGATKLFDSSGSVNGFSTSFFTVFPGLRQFISKRLAIYAYEPIVTPNQDPGCAGNCYSQCGTIEHIEGSTFVGNDLYLRFFYLRLGDIHQYVHEKVQKERVHVFAHTVLIDEDVNVDYALQVKTSQLIVDRNVAHFINVNSGAKELDMDMDFAKYHGPYPDIMHSKLSFTCARILLDTKSQTEIANAWRIMRGITASPAKNDEQKAFHATVRSYMAEVAGVDRTKTHYVPIYTPSHLAKVLETYDKQITIYKNDIDRLTDSTTSTEDFIKYAEEMNHIYMTTDITEATGAYEDAVGAIIRANATYTRMKIYFDIAKDELEVAKVEFEKGIKQYQNKLKAGALFNFIKGIGMIVVGAVSGNPGAIIGGAESIWAGAKGIAATFNDLAYTMNKIEELTRAAEENMERIMDMERTYDEEEFIADVEMMASLQVNVIQWANLKNQANSILADSEIVENVGGSVMYSAALMDMSNWGEALTSSMVERAEVMRVAMQKRSYLDVKLEQKKRLDALIEELKKDHALRETALAAMLEQTHDVRMDLNEALIMFCQAYFYQTLVECRNSYKPSFGGDLSNLLLKIALARQDVLLQQDFPSTSARTLVIEDTNLDPDCIDAAVCPINYLKKNRILYFNVPIGHPELNDRYKYRVAEIVLNVPGAKPSGDQTYLQFRIDVTGNFKSKDYMNNVYNFVTKPFQITFERSVVEDHISVRADIYNSQRGIYNHITPYTTWVMQVYEDRSGQIDLSGVTKVEMQLIGGSSNAYSEQDDNIHSSHSYIGHMDIPKNKDADSEAKRIFDKMYLGCFKEEISDRDIPFHILSQDAYLTVDKCVSMCSQQGFKIAGLQGGNNCYCGNSLTRKYNSTDRCDSKCPGNGAQICGGVDSNSVYRAHVDSKYAGCYKDSTESPDLPHKLWDTSSGKTAPDCIKDCMEAGHKYAGIQNGGSCFCGDSYGKYGEASEYECFVTCRGHGGHSCGGTEANSVYQAEPSYDITGVSIPTTATKLYDSTGNLNGMSTLSYTLFPGLRNFVTKKLAIYSSEKVLTPVENSGCGENCFQPCGNIENTDYFILSGEDVILRFFYFKLSDLGKHVGDNPKRVYIYAQTVMIDADVNAQFALSIRATQILIDRSTSHFIGVSQNAEDLHYDLGVAKFTGPDGDLIHQKFSYLCARILLDSRDQNNINNAWKVFTDIATSHTSSDESSSFKYMVQSYMTQVTGLDRSHVSFVPIYTKSHLSKILDTYYTQMYLYKLDMDRLQDQTTSDVDFVKLAENLNHIYTTTDIIEAENAYMDAIQGLQIANGTYAKMSEFYEASKLELDANRVEFEKGLKKHQGWAIADSVMGMVFGMSKLTFGIFNSSFDDVKEGVGQIWSGAWGLADAMEDLTYTVAKINELTKIADENMDRLMDMDNLYDPSKYIEDVELAVSLQINVVQWQNMKTQGLVVLNDPQVSAIDGAKIYGASFMDMTNWGEALTKSMIERAEIMRETMQRRTTYDLKLEQKKRVDEVIERLKQDASTRQAALATMVEQTYDVRLDMNEVLLMFCQAYYFENLVDCKESYRPSFGGDLSDLLVRISLAQRDGLIGIGIPSQSVSRYINIEDSNTDADCEDAAACPINYLRKHRILYFDLPVNHPELIDLARFQLAEIVLDVQGAKTTTDKAALQFRIYATGDFDSRDRNGGVYQFMTKPLAMAFEYDILTGEIIIHADVYGDNREAINHITPYTKWVMEVYEDVSHHIDLSQVTKVRMRVDGGAVSATKKTSILAKQISQYPIHKQDLTNEITKDTMFHLKTYNNKSNFRFNPKVTNVQRHLQG